MTDETTTLGFRKEILSSGGPGMNLGQAPGCHPVGPPHSLFAGYRKLYDLIHSVKER